MRQELDPFEQIKEQISLGNNFLLSGGAGSGKTTALIDTIKFIYEQNPNTSIACITFTKVAVAEIKSRTSYDSLVVSTIHEFLWSCIKDYQKELKIGFLELIDKELAVEKSGMKYSGDAAKLEISSVDYKDWVIIEKGIISHNEVLKLANWIFGEYPLLCKITKEKFNFILVDEYQDTDELVIEIFLKHFQNYDKSKNVMGFFGDKMQSIYSDSNDQIDEFISSANVQEVVKQDNWRCSKPVINLINKIRASAETDPIIQKPAGNNLEGSALFLYSNRDNIEIKEIKNHEEIRDFSFEKELYLTHNLISKKAGFDELLQIYDKDRIIEYVGSLRKNLKNNVEKEELVIHKTLEEVINLALVPPPKSFTAFTADNDELFNLAKKQPFEKLRNIYLEKDSLIEGGGEKKEGRNDKKDPLIKHLGRIETMLSLYKRNKVVEFRRHIEKDFPINCITDLISLKSIMDSFENPENRSCEEIINWADENKLVCKDDRFKEFVEKNEYTYHRVKQIKYSVFKNLYDFEQKNSPYSTQHGVKGAEFENVFVVLDNGNWNNYNFGYLFENSS